MPAFEKNNKKLLTQLMISIPDGLEPVALQNRKNTFGIFCKLFNLYPPGIGTEFKKTKFWDL